MLFAAAGQTIFVIAVLLLNAAGAATFAGARGSAPRNGYLPTEDVELGTEAAADIRSRVPVVVDLQVNAFLERLGGHLADQIPDVLRQPVFHYSFEILDQPYLKIYGLPGGPIFVSRGLVQAAASEKALATAIARQLSHIALRHGTTQATAGDRFQVGAITGHDIAAAIAGCGHDLTAQGAAFSAASYFLIFSNEFERQADRLALQLLAGAGYEHEAAAARSSDDFQRAQARLRDMPEPPASGPEARAVRTAGRIGVLGPSGAAHLATAGDSFLMSVPVNWERLPAGNTVVFAPDAGFVKTPRGTPSITHGIQVGVARSVTGDLQRDMVALLETLSRAGVNVRWRPSYQDRMMGSWPALTTTLVNVSAATDAFEQVVVCAAHLPGGHLLYLIGLSPLDESGIYRLAFDRVRQSIQPVR